MAQATSALGFVEIRGRVGHLLGYGSDSADWTSDQTTQLGQIVNDGVARFYNPPPVDGAAHRWSFLAPTYTFDTAASDAEYDLPDDYGEISGPIHYDNVEKLNNTVEFTSPERIQFLRNQSLTTGTPQWAAVRPKAQTAGTYQIWELLLWPTPNAILTVHLSYFRQVNLLSTANPYPWGGAVHSQTVLAACMAQAELYMDDATGNWEQRFQQQLLASVMQDRRAHGPATLGYNGTRMWRHGTWGGLTPSYPSTISIGGTPI